MQGEPSVISHQEESYSSPHSVDFHTGENRGRFPQQTQTAEVWFQTSPIRDSEDFLETANLAYTGGFRVQWELSDSQEHDLGVGLQGNGNQCPGLLLGSRNLDIPPVPPHSSSTGGGSRAADNGDSDLSGVEGRNMVASVDWTKDRMALICLLVAEDWFRFPRRSTEELLNLDPLYTFHMSRKVV